MNEKKLHPPGRVKKPSSTDGVKKIKIFHPTKKLTALDEEKVQLDSTQTSMPPEYLMGHPYLKGIVLLYLLKTHGDVTHGMI